MSGLLFIAAVLGYAAFCCFLGSIIDRSIKPISRLLTKWGF